MTIITIYVSNPSNPVEVQNWLDLNPTLNIVWGGVQNNNFYIVTNP